MGFGTFEVRERGARTGRDPRTNKEIQIPASQGPCLQGWQGTEGYCQQQVKACGGGGPGVFRPVFCSLWRMERR